MSKEHIRTGHYAWYVPHYRLGTYELLNAAPNMSFTVMAPKKYPGHFLKTEHDEVRFPFEDSMSLRVRLPFTQHMIAFHPRAVWDLLTRKYDVYLQSNNVLGLDVWINVVIGRLTRQPVCLWGHGISYPESGLERWLRKVLMRLAKAVVFYADQTRDIWIERGLPAEKLFVAPNALDTRISEALLSSVSAQDLLAFRRERGLIDKKVVVFVGRVQASKKVDVLIDAMSLVVQRVPEAHAVIIGDGPERERLAAMVERLGLESAVTLTGAVYDEGVVARYLLVSEAVAIPAAAGLGIQHAFGYGVPVIIGDDRTSHGPECELVVHEETGLYCRDNDPQDLAAAICRLLLDPQFRQSLSQAAMEKIRSRYNVHTQVKGMCEAIRYCVRSTRR